MLRSACLLIFAGFLSAGVLAGETTSRTAFVGWNDFSEWKLSSETAGSLNAVSPLVTAPIPFDELVLSWNLSGTKTADSVRFSVEIWDSEGQTSQFILGDWANGIRSAARTSINGQREAVGRVLTDTLVLTQPVRQFRVHVTLPSDVELADSISLVGASLLDSTRSPSDRAPNRVAWGLELAVPKRCQLDYPGGAVWCSPTSVCMLLSHWSNVRHRPELAVPVPQLAAAVYDPGWGGTGNWSFNTAFAGSFTGVNGYVIRLGDVTDLEAFIEQGIPVPVSVSYNVLKGKPRKPGDGHFVVCTGFAPNGDVVVNDPARQPRVRWVYDRAAFVGAWQHSQNTAYLIYPDGQQLPPDPGGRWSLGRF